MTPKQIRARMLEVSTFLQKQAAKAHARGMNLAERAAIAKAVEAFTVDDMLELTVPVVEGLLDGIDPEPESEADDAIARAMSGGHKGTA